MVDRIQTSLRICLMPENTLSISPDEDQTFRRFLEAATGFRSGDPKPYLVANRLSRWMTEAANGSLAQLIRRGASIEDYSLTACWNIAAAPRSLAGAFRSILHSRQYFLSGFIRNKLDSGKWPLLTGENSSFE
ncbi:hypothetical protein [Methylohalobius crimeensis]|uniref:hypothetical protein n=1 Tax=Methylohalobius crimeensis TaxID=244365 RepID=UPI001269460D|nr:hypothetical protein [Methylohalobius crimeensis]